MTLSFSVWLLPVESPQAGFQITRTKISYSLYSLIEPQPLSCTPACCYQFDTAAAHPQLPHPKKKFLQHL